MKNKIDSPQSMTPCCLEDDECDLAEPEKIFVPFTDEQTQAIANWQRWGSGARASCPKHDDPEITIVDADGIHCTAPDCSFVQTWAYAFALKAKYCTAESPYRGSDQTDYVIHVDAEETCPNWDGEVIPFHCPNCNRYFSIDFR